MGGRMFHICSRDLHVTRLFYCSKVLYSTPPPSPEIYMTDRMKDEFVLALDTILLLHYTVP